MPQSTGGSAVHRLGNLILLPPGMNSKLGAKAPKDKATDYTDTGLLVVQEVVGQLADWGPAAIEKRELKLMIWAEKEWAD